MGVNIHFSSGHTQDLDRIAAAGFKFIRMDLTWSSIETVKGVYDWSAYDDLISNLDQRGLRAILILDYNNQRHHVAIARTAGFKYRVLLACQWDECRGSRELLGNMEVHDRERPNGRQTTGQSSKEFFFLVLNDL